MEINRIVLGIILYGVIIGFGFGAVSFIAEWNLSPKVHTYPVEFELENKTSTMLLRFESDGGAFTTGNSVNVKAILGADVSTKTEEFFIIHFPNTLDPDTYEKISNEKNWNFNQTDTGIEYVFPAKNFANLINYPPRTETNVIWTQEGGQDMVLIFDKNPIFFDEFGKLAYGNHIVLEDVINIQSSDARLQIQSNNMMIGLTLAVICLAFVTGTAKYDPLKIKIKD